MEAKGQRVFGPVPSCRLGCSLGRDVVLAKAWSFNCVHCTFGWPSARTVDRVEYVPARRVLDGLTEGPQPRGGVKETTKAAAKDLGVNPSTPFRKIESLGIEPPARDHPNQTRK